MKEQPKIEVHDDVEVWVNPTTESLRREECLCLCCGWIRICPKAFNLYRIYREENLALIVTRCPDWVPITV